MSLASAFETLALAVSDAVGGPYHAAEAQWPGTPVMDDGGSIVTPGTPTAAACRVQVDRVTEAMRQAEGFTERDVALIVLGLPSLNTDARMNVTAGPHAGLYSLESCDRDPVAIGFVCRARRL